MSPEQRLALQTECKDEGSNVRLEWEGRNTFDHTLSAAPAYRYNPSLHTCLWFGNYIKTSFAAKRGAAGQAMFLQDRIEFVVDVSTKRALIEYQERNGKQLGPVSEGEFTSHKDELFGSN